MYNAFTEIAYTEEQAISFLYECKDHLWRKDFLDVGGIVVAMMSGFTYRDRQYQVQYY